MREKLLEIESYLFQSSDKIHRAIPFYELSIDEWIIYEDGKATYYIDFNRSTDPIVIDINNQLSGDIQPEAIIQLYGDSIGRQWTLKHNIEGNEVPRTERRKTVRLWALTNMSEFHTSGAANTGLTK